MLKKIKDRMQYCMEYRMQHDAENLRHCRRHDLENLRHCKTKPTTSHTMRARDIRVVPTISQVHDLRYRISTKTYDIVGHIVGHIGIIRYRWFYLRYRRSAKIHMPVT
jgi:hypothetical protein